MSLLKYQFYFSSIRMSEKGGKKKTNKSNKNTRKDKKLITLGLILVLLLKQIAYIKKAGKLLKLMM